MLMFGLSNKIIKRFNVLRILLSELKFLLHSFYSSKLDMSANRFLNLMQRKNTKTSYNGFKCK